MKPSLAIYSLSTFALTCASAIYLTPSTVIGRLENTSSPQDATSCYYDQDRKDFWETVRAKDDLVLGVPAEGTLVKRSGDGMAVRVSLLPFSLYYILSRLILIIVSQRWHGCVRLLFE
jgi:hypothetical protein